MCGVYRFLLKTDKFEGVLCTLIMMKIFSLVFTSCLLYSNIVLLMVFNALDLFVEVKKIIKERFTKSLNPKNI